MDVKTTQVGINMTTTTYKKLLDYCERTNSKLGNAIDALVSDGIDRKYEEFPNLLEKADD